MATNKPHVKLNIARQAEDSVPLRFNYGPIDDEDDENEPNVNPDYRQMATAFRGYLTRLQSDSIRRSSERNREIVVPTHIDYISILFQSQFSIRAGSNNYYQNWYEEFGLLGVNLSQFNHEVLFAVVDQARFSTFLTNIRNFIQKESGDQEDLVYSKKVVYIKSFKLLTSEDMIQFQQNPGLLNFRMIDFPLDAGASQEIFAALLRYMRAREIQFNLVPVSGNLEVYNVTPETAREIVANFDIILSVTSSLTGVVRPSEFNLPERGYGFSITNPQADLPIIGVLDTGISNVTPLAPLIINDTSFNLTSSSPLEDSVNNGEGHGTAVAALAALGRAPYSAAYRGNFTADARLLSMKILDSSSGYISELAILNLLRDAKQTYPDIKIFVLTTCYETPKRTNEDFSTYAYELDLFAHENDCLIFISTGNNDQAAFDNNSYDFSYFFGERTNLCSPAESMNNVVVGAAAHDLRDGIFRGISPAREHPTMFTRKSPFDLQTLFPRIKQNKNYFRPDIIECGGDYEQGRNFIGQGPNASLDLLSANPAFGFYPMVGTSFSTPLAANTAAKIQKYYPALRAQTLKALLINGASLDNMRVDSAHKTLVSRTAGNGLVEPGKSILSNENSITFVVEGEINPEEVKIIPVHFPRYLCEDDLGKRNGILRVSATLCFSFRPVLYNQLSYCPIHMAFSFYKNQSGAEILSSEETIQSKLKNTLTWSQNGRYKGKPIPCSNSQKIIFPVNLNELVSEDCTFKLLLNCRVSSQLIPGVEDQYAGPHPFSIVITVEEKLRKGRETNRLYDEMIAVNEVENIADIELENEEGLAEAEG